MKESVDKAGLNRFWFALGLFTGTVEAVMGQEWCMEYFKARGVSLAHFNALRVALKAFQKAAYK